jgi:hypothetical protein
MPLSPPPPRQPSHRRDISLNGYARDDGLFDIEAHLVDTKPVVVRSQDRGHIPPGEPIHEMWLRVTIDEAMAIVACEAVTDYGPFNECPGGAANFPGLVGLTIRPGFLREAAARVGGAAGCTHLRELLQQVGTTAFQSMWAVRARRREQRRRELEAQGIRPSGPPDDGARRLLNSCLAYDDAGETVKRLWPHLARGARAEG